MTIKGYTATRDEHDVLTIHDVPIFLECERNDVKFDRKWISEAVKKAKMAERDGYLPPLHIRHHEMATEMNDSVRPAGYFRITKTREITFKGDRKLAVFADLMITDPMASIDVLAKRLPYRSVEIFNVDKPSLDSLALLDHEAPFLELPMLMISEVKDFEPAKQIDAPTIDALFANAKTFDPGAESESKEDRRVVVCFRRGNAAALLTQESRMDDQQTTEEPQIDETPVESEVDAKVDTTENFAADGPPIPPKPEGDEDKSESTEGDSDDEGVECSEVESVVAAIQEGTISIADFAAIRAAMEAQEAAQQPQQQQQPQNRPMGSAPAPAVAPGGQAMSKKEGMTAREAELRGRIDALEAKDADRERSDKRREDVNAAMERLKDRPIGANFREKLEDMHKEGGPVAFAKYVDSLVETFGAVPADTGDGANFAAQTGDHSEEVLSWHASGTEAVERASRFSAMWKQLREGGYVAMSEEAYVGINMGKLGFKKKSA